MARGLFSKKSPARDRTLPVFHKAPCAVSLRRSLFRCAENVPTCNGRGLWPCWSSALLRWRFLVPLRGRVVNHQSCNSRIHPPIISPTERRRKIFHGRRSSSFSESAWDVVWVVRASRLPSHSAAAAACLKPSQHQAVLRYVGRSQPLLCMY